MFDPEEKITEFEYEKFIPQAILKTMDTDSQEFKNYVKLQNLKHKTNIENHRLNQQAFSSWMPLFAGLTDDEKRDLVHLIENQPRKWNHLEKLVTKEFEHELAEL